MRFRDRASSVNGRCGVQQAMLGIVSHLLLLTIAVTMRMIAWIIAMCTIIVIQSSLLLLT